MKEKLTQTEISDIWNEAIFDGLEGDDLETITEAFNLGNLADYEPEDENIYDMDREDIIANAKQTVAYYLQSH